MPPIYSNRNTINRRFRRWSKAGVAGVRIDPACQRSRALARQVDYDHIVTATQPIAPLTVPPVSTNASLLETKLSGEIRFTVRAIRLALMMATGDPLPSLRFSSIMAGRQPIPHRWGYLNSAARFCHARAARFQFSACDPPGFATPVDHKPLKKHILTCWHDGSLQASTVEAFDDMLRKHGVSVMGNMGRDPIRWLWRATRPTERPHTWCHRIMLPGTVLTK